MIRRLARLVLLAGAVVAVLVAIPQTRQALRNRVSVRGALALLGLRAETSGSGRPTSLQLDRLEDHYRALEEKRALDEAAARGLASPGAAEATVQPGGAAILEPESAPNASTASSASASSASALSPAPFNLSGANAPPDGASSEAAWWPDFRGARRDGRYAGPDVLMEWPTGGLKQLWRTPIGGGYASMTTFAGRLFTIEQRRSQEVVAAYDLETGRELWTSAWDAAFSEALGGDGPRATPVYADGRLYTLGALGELRALDAATGRLHWRVNIVDDNAAENLQWGMAASPLVLDDVVVVLPGGRGGRSVVAYDRVTGARRWSALDEQQAYVAPMDVVLDGVRQLLIVSAARTLGLSLDGRSVLWSFPWETQFGINSSQPIVFDGRRVFLSSGYGHGAAVLEVRQQGGVFSVEPIWQNVRMKNKFTSSVLFDGHIYGLDEAILACVDAATGALKWKGGRYGYGQLVLVKDQLWVTTEDGDVVQVAASPDGHKELGRFSALEGKTWNHPIVSAGRLIVRNQTDMAAFDIRVPSRAPSAHQ